jgi:hypothetical protein
MIIRLEWMVEASDVLCWVFAVIFARGIKKTDRGKIAGPVESGGV